MLIVGRVESVSPSPSDPLRQVIVVRPTVNIERLSELLLRLQAMGGVEGAAR
jgi:cell shape-determining protein MreC